MEIESYFKSNLSKYGLLFFAFGLLGLFMTRSPTVPDIDDLLVTEGVYLGLKSKKPKGEVSYFLSLSVDGERREYNASRCAKYLRNMDPGETVRLYIDTSRVISLNDGAIWQVMSGSEHVCDYSDVVNNHYDARKSENTMSLYILLLGSLLFVAGVLRVSLARH